MKSEVVTRKISQCAPMREAVENGDGTYYTTKWTVGGVQSAKSAGMWFYPGAHEFADSDAVKAAFGKIPQHQQQ